MTLRDGTGRASCSPLCSPDTAVLRKYQPNEQKKHNPSAWGPLSETEKAQANARLGKLQLQGPETAFSKKRRLTGCLAESLPVTAPVWFHVEEMVPFIVGKKQRQL